MWGIAKREYKFYFTNLTGYLVIGSYLTINTLILWFFDTPYNFLNYEVANIDLFFELSPWLLVVLISSLSLGSFSEEISTGTIELLLTKPLNPYQIFTGKFLGLIFIFSTCFLITLINILALNSLLKLESELDFSSIITSYLGLFLVGLIFISICLCCSLLFRSLVLSFLTGFILCFFQFFMWDFMASLVSDPLLYEIISSIGIKKHYISLSRGIIKLDDIIYLIGSIIIFHMLGVNQIKKSQHI